MTITTVPITPARRVILAVGVPLVLVMIGFIAKTGVYQTILTLTDRHEVGYSVAFSVPATGNPVRVTSAGEGGDLSLRPGAGSRIAVRGSLRGSYARPTFSYRSTAAGLTLDPQCRVPTGRCQLSFAVTTPAGLGVTASDSFGDLKASGLRGAVSLSDNSGDLTASGLSGNIRLNDIFGNLTADGLSGTAWLQNNSGDISASNISGDTTVRDSFGDVMITGMAAARVICSNQSGDVTISFSRVPQRVTVNDSFGNVILKLPPGSTAYNVYTSASFGNENVSVPRSPSSPHVITVTDNSGNITIVS